MVKPTDDQTDVLSTDDINQIKTLIREEPIGDLTSTALGEKATSVVKNKDKLKMAYPVYG